MATEAKITESKTTGTKIVKDPEYGYLRIDPVPTQEELDRYYKESYLASAETHNRACEIGRQQRGGSAAGEETVWLQETLYTDLLHILREYSKKPYSLLDVGSGSGAFMRYARDSGWLVRGVEPSEEACHMETNDSLDVFNGTLEAFGDSNGHKFSAVTILNVLEHVPNPMRTLLTVRKMLNGGGILCIRVPNDFSVLQTCAERVTGKNQWWVVTPDHINYFDPRTLSRLCAIAGFDTMYATTDFPMEIFLLMGDDYVGNQKIGDACHTRRRNFEMALPGNLRRELYHRLASIGVGRSCILFLRKRSGGHPQ